MTLLGKIRNVNPSIFEQNDTIMTKYLLLGNIFFDVTSNTLTLNAIISSKIFDASIFLQYLQQF